MAALGAEVCFSRSFDKALKESFRIVSEGSTRSSTS